MKPGDKVTVDKRDGTFISERRPYDKPGCVWVLFEGDVICTLMRLTKVKERGKLVS